MYKNYITKETPQAMSTSEKGTEQQLRSTLMGSCCLSVIYLELFKIKLEFSVFHEILLHISLLSQLVWAFVA